MINSTTKRVQLLTKISIKKKNNNFKTFDYQRTFYHWSYFSYDLGMIYYWHRYYQVQEVFDTKVFKAYEHLVSKTSWCKRPRPSHFVSLSLSTRAWGPHALKGRLDGCKTLLGYLHGMQRIMCHGLLDYASSPPQNPGDHGHSKSYNQPLLKIVLLCKRAHME